MSNAKWTPPTKNATIFVTDMHKIIAAIGDDEAACEAVGEIIESCGFDTDDKCREFLVKHGWFDQKAADAEHRDYLRDIDAAYHS